MKKGGFTLIELLITGALVVLAVAVIVSSFSSFSKNQGLGNTADMILTAIGEARSKTLSSEGSNQFGVHFASSSATVFSGIVYDAASATNIVYKFPLSSEVSLLSLSGGGSDVVFQKITGKTDQYGSVTIRLKSNIATTEVININNSGIPSI